MFRCSLSGSFSISSSGFSLFLLGTARFVGFVGFLGSAGLLVVILLLLWLKGVLVGDSNTHEVHVDGDNDGGNEDGEEDILLLGLAPVSRFWGSVGDLISLEEGKEIPGVPSGQKSN